MPKLSDIATIFSFFFKTGLRSKRTKLFIFLSLIPAVIFLIFRIIKMFNPQLNVSFSVLFNLTIFPYYFEVFIQILSLFFGSSVINDEVEDQTLTYLTNSPVSKTSIITGKFLATFFTSATIITIGYTVSTIIAYFSLLLNAKYLIKALAIYGTAILAILAYSALFTLLGSFLKKSVIAGIFFIFFWEKFVQFLPGATQKLTIIHYVKSLVPIKLPKGATFLIFNLQHSSAAESILVLILVSILCLAAATYLFNKKEYILAKSV